MKVTVDQILEKIEKLPADVSDLVALGGHGWAEVQSARLDGPTEPYKTHITTHADDTGDRTQLRATCSCVAHALCWHICAHYAIAKKSDPAVVVAMTKRKGLPADPPAETVPPEEGKEANAPLSRRAEGLKLIARSIQKVTEAFQDLADGIALVVKEE